MSIRVLIVDDQELLRVGFRLLLDAEDDLEVVAEAADGIAAIEAVREHAPDVVLMDVRMPGLDGIEATRRIVGERPETRVLVLTTFDLDEYAFGAIQAGASGFLLKDAPPAQVAQSIRAVHAGEASLSPRITRRMLELVDADALRRADPGQAAKADARLAPLTPREREILQFIGQGLTNGEIATKLYVAESTVKTHVGRVLGKLELRDRVHAVIVAYETGLVG
jgi:DNA-binding NarL/FixJ family response regulator